MGNFTACVSIQHALKSPVRIHLKALLFSQGLYEVLSQSIPLLTVTILRNTSVTRNVRGRSLPEILH